VKALAELEKTTNQHSTINIYSSFYENSNIAQDAQETEKTKGRAIAKKAKSEIERTKIPTSSGMLPN